ncbi:MAG: radical SAM protein [Ignavibacteria bacterium]|nr:radical SAM protein [Ignavibacteria bacterium]
MPLSLVALASNLDEKEYEVLIIDARLEKDPINRLISSSKDAICVGMTVLTGAPIKNALAASRTLKKLYPRLKIIWGGWHTSLFPTDTLMEESIDVTVQGQGENVFASLVEKISNGGSFSGLRGICYKEEGKIIRNPPCDLKDMNELGFQKYEHIPVEGYFKLKGQRQFDFISSIGCFFRCSFCADPQVYNRKWSALSPERMGEEISFQWNKYKFAELAFQDETFFTYKDRAISIADEFLKRNLKFKWTATMRADQGSRLSEDIFKHLVRSGLRWVLIGVESGSNEMLNWLKKDITVEQVMYCAEICKKFGIAAHFPVIIGFPGESDRSVKQSLAIANKLREMSPKFETPVFYYKPYPGSNITTEVEKQGYKMPASLEEWADFDYIGSSGPWVTKEKYKYVEKFKFYNRFSGGKERVLKKPLKTISRWRIRNDNFAFSIEKSIIETIKPQEKVS